MSYDESFFYFCFSFSNELGDRTRIELFHMLIPVTPTDLKQKYLRLR